MKDIVLDLGEHITSFSLNSDGEVHGTVLIQGANGSSRCEYSNGRKHGKFSESFGMQGYHSDGTIGHYEHGQKHGYWEHYQYDDENYGDYCTFTYLVSEGKYHHGKKVGTWKYYRYPDCIRGSMEPYIGEEPFEGLETDIVMKVEERFDEYKAVSETYKCRYFSDDRFKVKKTYYLNEDGEIHGPCSEYNKDGKLIKEGNYQNGKEDGEETVQN